MQARIWHLWHIIKSNPTAYQHGLGALDLSKPQLSYMENGYKNIQPAYLLVLLLSCNSRVLWKLQSTNQVKSINMQFCVTLTGDILMQLYFHELLVGVSSYINRIGNALLMCASPTALDLLGLFLNSPVLAKYWSELFSFYSGYVFYIKFHLRTWIDF